MESDNTKERLLTAEEMADVFHVSKATIYKFMQSGEIPTVRMGRLVRVKLSDLENYLQEYRKLYGEEKNG